MTEPSIDRRIAGALDRAMGGVERMQNALVAALMMPRQGEASTPVGTLPGIESVPETKVRPEPGEVGVQCIDYAPGRTELRAFDDLDALLAVEQPDWAAVRWIRIDGVHPYVVNLVCESLGLHTLAAEDIVHAQQRPRLEEFDSDLFVVAQLMGVSDVGIKTRQLSAFVKPGLLVTFLEKGPDVFAPIVARLKTRNSRLQSNGPDFLVYALLDAVVDSCFPALERFSEELEGLEGVVMSAPEPTQLQRVQIIKHELSAVRRVAWPTRELVHALGRDDTPLVTEMTRTYLRDVDDHLARLTDVVETLREMGNNLSGLYMSVMSNRMNETMRVLTIMASLFIPVTFLAGVYGMNFEHMPELKWEYGYAYVWAVMGGLAVVMGLFFRFRRWF